MEKTKEVRGRKIKKKILGMIEFYRFYKYNQDLYNRRKVSNTTFRKVLKAFNLGIKNLILEDAAKITLPSCMGTLRVKKYKRLFIPNKKKKWKINWKETKKQGHYVYYTEQPFLYKIVWRHTNRYYWFFSCRTMSRELASKIINEHKDYFE